MPLSWRHLTAVFFLYVVLSVVYTWPLAPNLASHVPDVRDPVSEHHDAALATWYPWWAQRASLDDDKDVLYSDWVYFPAGMEMTMQPMMLLHGWMTIPLAWLAFPTAHNVVILLSYAISGLGAFLLGYHVLKSIPGAFLCGFVYATLRTTYRKKTAVRCRQDRGIGRLP